MTYVGYFVSVCLFFIRLDFIKLSTLLRLDRLLLHLLSFCLFIIWYIWLIHNSNRTDRIHSISVHTIR